jgi:hypothetical protein
MSSLFVSNLDIPIEAPRTLLPPILPYNYKLDLHLSIRRPKAEVLVELVFTNRNSHARVFHPLNLHLTTWETLLPAVIKSLSAVSKGKTIATVPFETWLQQVRAKADVSTASDQSKLASLLEINPAVKLLSFYGALGAGEKLPSLQTTKTAKESEKLRGLEAIKPEWIQSWAKGWVS